MAKKYRKKIFLFFKFRISSNDLNILILRVWFRNFYQDTKRQIEDLQVSKTFCKTNDELIEEQNQMSERCTVTKRAYKF